MNQNNLTMNSPSINNFTIDPSSRESLPLPYLDNPPDIIPINVGRQLFVDDYLIAQTTLTRVYHAAQKRAAAPVLRPETALEMNGGHCPVAAPFNAAPWEPLCVPG